MGGAQIAQAITVCWAALVAVNAIPPTLPQKPVPISGPVAVPSLTGTKVPAAVHVAWQADTAAKSVAAIVADNLNPPLSGPPPQNPPISGARSVPAAVQISWQRPDLAPITSGKYNPVLFTVTAPPPIIGSAVPAAVLIAWNAPALAILLPSVGAPQPIPDAVPARAIPQEIYRNWDARPLAPIVADNLSPPISGPTPQNPPIIGSRVSAEILVGWIPPAPAPIVAINLDPPINGPAPQNPPVNGSRVPAEVLIAWLPPSPAPIVAKNLNPPQSGAVAFPFPGSAVPSAVLASWSTAFVAIPLSQAVSPQVTPTVPDYVLPKIFSQEIYRNWEVPLPAPMLARLPSVPASGPTPQNPPFMGGARVSLEVQIGWLPPAPAPIVGPKLTASQQAPSNPPIIGARVPTEVQIAWLPQPIAPIVGPKFTAGAAPVTTAPGASAVPLAVLTAWDGRQYSPVVAANLNPALLTGPVAPFPFAGTRVSTEIQVSWLAPYIAPIVGPKFTSGAIPAAFPFVGSRIPLAVLRSWDVPAPLPSWTSVRVTISGPVPSAPPIGGAARIPSAVHIAWIAPRIDPITGTAFPVGATPAVFVQSQRVVFVASENREAVAAAESRSTAV